MSPYRVRSSMLKGIQADSGRVVGEQEEKKPCPGVSRKSLGKQTTWLLDGMEPSSGLWEA